MATIHRDETGKEQQMEETDGKLFSGNKEEPDTERAKSQFHQVPGQVEYEGLILQRPFVTPEVVERVKTFKTFPADIIVAGYPKTGTSWMEEIVFLVSTCGDFATAKSVELYERSRFLENYYVPHGKPEIDILSSKIAPRLMKTHLPMRFLKTQALNDTTKIIVTIRNPKDVIVSFFYFYKMKKLLGPFTGTWDEFFELFRAKKLLFEDYFDWYKGWWQLKNAPNILFVQYEHMLGNLEHVIRQVAQLFEVNISDDLLKEIANHVTFQNMKTNPMVNFDNVPFFDTKIAHFMRKGTVGDWKNHFTESQSAYVDTLCKNILEPLGLLLQFDASCGE